MNKEQFFHSIQGKTVTFCGIGRSHMPLIRLFQEKGALVSARDKHFREADRVGSASQCGTVRQKTRRNSLQ